MSKKKKSNHKEPLKSGWDEKTQTYNLVDDHVERALELLEEAGYDIVDDEDEEDAKSR